MSPASWPKESTTEGGASKESTTETAVQQQQQQSVIAGNTRPTEPKPNSPERKSETEQTQHEERPAAKRTKRDLAVGTKLVIPDTDVVELTAVLDRLWLPKLPYGGYGVTLGVEKYEGLACVSPWNDKFADAVTTINALLKDKVGVETYRWSTIQIEKTP